MKMDKVMCFVLKQEYGMLLKNSVWNLVILTLQVFLTNHLIQLNNPQRSHEIGAISTGLFEYTTRG